jgi:hypothetical protein
MEDGRAQGRNAQSSMIWFLQMAQLSTRMSHAQIETADHCRATEGGIGAAGQRPSTLSSLTRPTVGDDPVTPTRPSSARMTDLFDLKLLAAALGIFATLFDGTLLDGLLGGGSLIGSTLGRSGGGRGFDRRRSGGLGVDVHGRHGWRCARERVEAIGGWRRVRRAWAGGERIGSGKDG